jgi:predicted MFS family arabinose efflux permease
VSSRQHPVLSACLLALWPAIGIGIARFAYGLLLPAMKSDLAWSYFQSGLMNTINALGCLAGALIMGRLTRRWGGLPVFLAGVGVTIISVLLVGTTRGYAPLAAYRLAAGLGGAAIFVAGGTLCSALSQRTPERSGAILSVFYAGPGLGVAMSAVSICGTFALFGQHNWQAAWLVLGLICLTAGLGTLLLKSEPSPHPSSRSHHQQDYQPLRHWKILAGYVLFGTGSIGYMTFMVTNLQQGGVSTDVTALFWLTLGLGAMAAPLLWSALIRQQKHGRAFAILAGINAVAAIPPLISGSIWPVIFSAALFGSCFFSVVASTTAFATRNVRPADISKAIATFTLAFGLGQAAGPLLTGAIADLGDGLDRGLALSIGLVALGATLGLAQRDTDAQRRLALVVQRRHRAVHP